MEPRLQVLVTGANGFVGRPLCRCLAERGWSVRGAVRALDERFPEGAQPAAVGNIGPATDWQPWLAGGDAVVHLAAHVHVMRAATPDSLAEFRAVNTQGTLKLAGQAAAAGVRRFIFVSTVKVLGEGKEAPYRDTDGAAPHDAYGISKQEAEEGLRRIEAATGMAVTILRPPLVYGPGVGANFLRLLRLVESGWPLPLASVTDNRRSMIYVGNLVDAILRCVEHPAAAGRTFLVSDGEDLSTAALIRQLATAAGRAPRLLPCPPAALALAARLVGKQAEANRLLGSLAVDAAPIRQALGWTPPFTVAQGIAETERWHAAPRG